LDLIAAFREHSAVLLVVMERRVQLKNVMMETMRTVMAAVLNARLRVGGLAA